MVFKKVLISTFIIFLLVIHTVFATNKVDSLLKKVTKASTEEQITIYNQIAEELTGSNDSLAIQYANKAIILSQKTGKKKEEAIALAIIGGCQTRFFTDSTSLTTLRKSLRIFESIGVPFETIKCYTLLGVSFYNLGDFKKAQEYNFKALSMAREYKNQAHESWILYNIGNIYLSQNEYPLALDNFLSSLAVEEKRGNQEGIAYCLNDLAHIYHTIQMDSIAENYYLRSLNIFKERRYLLEQAIIYNNLGDLYSSRKQYKDAEYFFREAISIKSKLGNISSLALTYDRIGDLFFNQGIKDSADHYFQKAILFADQSGREQYKASALLGYGKSLIAGNDIRNAEKVLIQSEELAKKLDLIEVRHDALLGLSKIDSIQKRFEQSRERLSIAVHLSNYLNKENSKRQMAEMSVKYETAKKEKELITQQTLVKKQQLIMLGLALFAILVIALIVLIYRQYRIIKKTSAELSKQKEEIDIKNQKLHELDELKNRFYTNISHELRTPLTLIVGNLEVLYERESQDGQDKTIYETMLRHSRRLLDLINQLLDISKLEKGKMRLSLQKGNISQFVTLLASSYSSWAQDKRIIFNYNKIDYNCDGWFDADKLEKVIVNLLSNAFKYTPTHGTVTLTLNKDVDKYSITVSDTGEGLDNIELSKIWELFYQSETHSNKLYQGSGIGLALVKELVQLMQGDIEAASEKGKGTIFTVKLPLIYQFSNDIDSIEQTTDFIFEKPIHPVDSIKNTIEEIKPQSDSDSDLVLVVEDNNDLRHFISSNLHKKYRVIEAQDGKIGLEKALETIPDLIISDVMMPEMNGLEMTTKLKNDERTSHIPVILLTARVSQEHIIEGLETGADEYLSKPFSVKELSLRIKNLFTTRQLLRDKLCKMPELNLSEISISSLDEKLLQRAIEHIEAHMDDSDYEVTQFCSDMGMSRTNLHRKLKAITNQSTTEFIRNIRLRRAAQLLKHNAGNVSEIAYQTGFNNLSYFAKNFKELFGVSPSEYTGNEKK